MENIKNVIKLVDDAIKIDAENNIMGGEIISDNFDEKVDHYRRLVSNSKDWLTNYQSELSEKYGLSSLKIKYTSASGYFIEIPKSQVTKIPDIFVHKQTLVNASRFITPELKEFELEILDAEGKKAEREYEIFLSVRDKILDSFNDIKEVSDKTAFIDFIASMGEIAYSNNFVKPEINKNYNFSVMGGRHIVIEQTEKDFISNDLNLTNNKYVHIITGPNMGGKSTFLRQNALIVLLAHMGSFVPAKKAIIPITDKIFSRIGANDNLFLGQSTFMVEMQEIANILNNSTKKSFVIIDEVGRGTSTYDGMSLAWAILKENHDNIKAKTLFATHYHELIDESKNLSGVANFSVAVGENEENLVFLRKIIPGGIKKSFGLEVAKIAGLSKSTITEAKKMLKMLELEHAKISGTQLSLSAEPVIEYIEKDSEVEKLLKQIDVNNLTPMDALNKISELKNKL
ncbi:MAG: DNA mismatch repair protein MutS [Candidatus Gracilibacteria bacterium]